MARKLLGIVLAIAIITSSIGYHVIRHHCIWCGGDRVEFVSVGYMEESNDARCHNENDQSHHDCGDDACCLPGLLKLDHAVASEDGHNQVKVSCTAPIIHQYYLPFNSYEGFLKPSENSFTDNKVDPPFRIHAARLIAFRC
jgi:hypothetical protein